ncbi:MAG: hypothetical protein KC800_21725, partial [Candidatus Eremiobacteraeota bacterium]|nr:hypothetical protein [Candidatus Eremiobacteraeota bacterium]
MFGTPTTEQAPAGLRTRLFATRGTELFGIPTTEQAPAGTRTRLFATRGTELFGTTTTEHRSNGRFLLQSSAPTGQVVSTRFYGENRREPTHDRHHSLLTLNYVKKRLAHFRPCPWV